MAAAGGLSCSLPESSCIGAIIVIERALYGKAEKNSK
jgi:hypothetical protein